MERAGALFQAEQENNKQFTSGVAINFWIV